MKPIQYYIGILSVLGYVYCLPVVGQVRIRLSEGESPFGIYRCENRT